VLALAPSGAVVVGAAEPLASGSRSDPHPAATSAARTSTAITRNVLLIAFPLRASPGAGDVAGGS
jgi:hypothetical protein